MFIDILAAAKARVNLAGREAFAKEILFRQNVGRYANAWDHAGRSYFYYLYAFPASFMPWSLAFPGVVCWALMGRRTGNTPDFLFPLAWARVVFLFFSLCSAKRSVYMIPIVMAPDDLTAFMRGPKPASVLLKRRYLPEVFALLGGNIQVLWEGRLGGRKLALVSNHPPPEAGFSN